MPSSTFPQEPEQGVRLVADSAGASGELAVRIALVMEQDDRGPGVARELRHSGNRGRHVVGSRSRRLEGASLRSESITTRFAPISMISRCSQPRSRAVERSSPIASMYSNSGVVTPAGRSRWSTNICGPISPFDVEGSAGGAGEVSDTRTARDAEAEGLGEPGLAGTRLATDDRERPVRSEVLEQRARRSASGAPPGAGRGRTPG